MLNEKLGGVDFADFGEGDVGSFVLESTIHEDIVVGRPARVAETLHRVEFVPFAGFGIVDFERNNFSHLVGSSSDNHHEWTQEDG